jgi:hypothetical protein
LDYLTTHTSPSPIWRGRGFTLCFGDYKKGCTRFAVACDKIYKLLAHGRWFSPASFTTKTGRHDIFEILLKAEITKDCLALPNIRSGKDSLFTRPNRISQDWKKYQAFPAVVAFNQGLPVFPFLVLVMQINCIIHTINLQKYDSFINMGDWWGFLKCFVRKFKYKCSLS